MQGFKNSKGKFHPIKNKCISISKIGKSTKPDSFFNIKQLKIGTRIEREHTDDPIIAKRIAKDHLEEFPNYYKELIKLEKKLEKQNG